MSDLLRIALVAEGAGKASEERAHQKISSGISQICSRHHHSMAEGQADLHSGGEI